MACGIWFLAFDLTVFFFCCWFDLPLSFDVLLLRNWIGNKVGCSIAQTKHSSSIFTDSQSFILSFETARLFQFWFFFWPQTNLHAVSSTLWCVGWPPQSQDCPSLTHFKWKPPLNASRSGPMSIENRPWWKPSQKKVSLNISKRPWENRPQANHPCVEKLPQLQWSFHRHNFKIIPKASLTQGHFPQASPIVVTLSPIEERSQQNVPNCEKRHQLPNIPISKSVHEQSKVVSNRMVQRQGGHLLFADVWDPLDLGRWWHQLLCDHWDGCCFLPFFSFILKHGKQIRKVFTRDSLRVATVNDPRPSQPILLRKWPCDRARRANSGHGIEVLYRDFPFDRNQEIIRIRRKAGMTRVHGQIREALHPTFK